MDTGLVHRLEINFSTAPILENIEQCNSEVSIEVLDLSSKSRSHLMHALDLNNWFG